MIKSASARTFKLQHCKAARGIDEIPLDNVRLV